MNKLSDEKLIPSDLRYVVQRLPRDVRDLLSAHNRKLFVGGGFVRACIAKEEPSDIDLFGTDKDRLEIIAKDLVGLRPGSRMHKTKNAITVITPDRMPIQFITRWTFENAADLVKSFDFTICQAALWREGNQSNSPWMSTTSNRFYIDLAGKNLVYTNPVREEEAGGSLLRALKYVKRGYSIQVGSLGEVIDRLIVSADALAERNKWHRATAMDTLLREVDPLLVIDGLDVVDDHQPIEGEGT